MQPPVPLSGHFAVWCHSAIYCCAALGGFRKACGLTSGASECASREAITGGGRAAVSDGHPLARKFHGRQTYRPMGRVGG